MVNKIIRARLSLCVSPEGFSNAALIIEVFLFIFLTSVACRPITSLLSFFLLLFVFLFFLFFVFLFVCFLLRSFFVTFFFFFVVVHRSSALLDFGSISYRYTLQTATGI